jgi:membrane-associated protein
MFSSVIAAGGSLDPEHLIDTVGLLGVFLIVFAESGLLIGFFLPGDSLLFTAGFFASSPSSIPESLHLPLLPLLIGLAVAAIAGDQVGYLVGNKVGPALFRRPDSRFFKQSHVEKAQAYFERYGAKTIVLARFVPVVRTFTPIIAGVSKMHYRTFVTFNILGGMLWALGVTLLGYFLGQVDFIADNLEITILAIVAISCLPVVIEVVRHRRSSKTDAATAAGSTPSTPDPAGRPPR